MIDTTRPPMAHRIRIEKRYEPSFDTDIRRTFERERNRLAREAFAAQSCRNACPNDERFVDAA